MLQVSSLRKAFGDRELFEDVCWQIDERERIALCGPNGAGKTTLLKILAGLEEPDAGEITKPAGLTIGYLPQDGLTHTGRSLYDEVSRAFQTLVDTKAEMHALEARLGDVDIPEDEHAAMLARYSELQHLFRDQEGYEIDLKIATVLRGLGFDPAAAERQTDTFSGGWQMRIALATLLLQRPNLLLLDEPTNHLDLEARNWLEEFLSSYPHAVVLVSHDRYFLDTVVTGIVEVGLKTLTAYPGNYSQYLAEREARMSRLRELKRRQDEEIARMRVFIDRFRYQATKAAQVQSRIKMLEKITPIDVPPERKRVHFSFPACAKSGRLVVELRHAAKSYGDITVFRQANVHIERGDRTALVGPNGAGKSTMMRMLSGVEPPDTGTRLEGHQVVMQYFAQDEAARLDPTLTVYETLEAGSPMAMVPMIRNILGGFLFSGDDISKRVGVLSGGERTRLAVARMLLRPANTLLLDEPTNHLDIDSTDVLLEALQDFGGTLILVSHDRYFVDRLATKILDIGGGEAVSYPGVYEEFRWSKSQAQQPGPPGSPTPQPRWGGPPGPPARQPRWGDAPGDPERALTVAPARTAPSDGRRAVDERKKVQAETRRRRRQQEALQARIESLEHRIADRERAIRDLEAAMAAPDFYQDAQAARSLIERHQGLMWEVGELMSQWEELHTRAQSTSTGS